MKKSSFVALVMGTVSGVLFALGMCMALVEEWAAVKPGVLLGVLGLALGVVTLLIWRRMANQVPLHISVKTVGQVVYGIASALVFGVGLCLCLAGGNIVLGTGIGLAGVIMLMGLIPLVKGLK